MSFADPLKLEDVAKLEDVEMPDVKPKHEVEPQADEEMDDLFGNDDDLDETKPASDALPQMPQSPVSSEDADRARLNYDEPEEAADIVAEQATEANVPLPVLPAPCSSDGNHWVIRMPNFVRVDSKPFHPDIYLGPEHDEDAGGATQDSMSIKLRVENTLRWRWTKNELGQEVRQSNARVVRWSDGTLSLRLGKELFDINRSIDTSAANPSLQPQSQQSQAQSEPNPNPAAAAGLTYLVAQHKRAQLLQAAVAITGTLTLRPTGMQSATHRMLVRSVGQRHSRVARLRMAPEPTVDPAREVLEIAKQNAKKSRKRELGAGGGRKKGGRRRAAAEWSDDEDMGEDGGYGSEEEPSRVGRAERKREGEYEEDDFLVADEDDDDEEGGAKKRKRAGAVEEEEGEDELEAMEAQLEARKKRAKKTGAVGRKEASFSSDGEEDVEVESEEEEDEEIKVRRAGAGARKKRAIDFDDDEDDDE